jgi:PASTA domain
VLSFGWAPGIDNSGRIDEFVLYVDGSEQGRFPSTQLEAAVGAFDYGDARRFTLTETDEAGNESAPAGPLRVVPELVGKTVEEARAALEARGFRVGVVTTASAPGGAAPGTVVSPSDPSVRGEGTAVDLVLAAGVSTPPPPSGPFVFRVAQPKTLTTGSPLAARAKATRGAQISVALVDPSGAEIRTWERALTAGATLVRLPLRGTVATGRYTLVWTARSDEERVTRRQRLEIVSAKGRIPRVSTGARFDVVLATDAPLRPALARRLGPRATIIPAADDTAFDLAASWQHNVVVVVVDVDEHGLGFVRELHEVFPDVRIVALASSDRQLRESVKAGATAARFRSTPRDRIAELVARLALPPARHAKTR